MPQKKTDKKGKVVLGSVCFYFCGPVFFSFYNFLQIKKELNFLQNSATKMQTKFIEKSLLKNKLL